MKKVILIFAILSAAFTMQAQNVTKDKQGNYIAITRLNTDSSKATNTGKTYTDTKGISYPVYISVNGKLFVNRISKLGNSYKMYLKL